MKKASIIQLTIIGMLISTTALSAEAHGRRHRGMRRMLHQMREQASMRPPKAMETQETSEQAAAPMQQLPAQQTPVQVAQETSAQQSSPAPASAPAQGIAVGEPNPSGISLSQSNTNSTSISTSSPGSTEEHKETMLITTASLDSGDVKELGSAAKEGQASASAAPIIPTSLLPAGDDFVPTKLESLDMNFASVMGKDISGAVQTLINNVSSSMVEGAKKEESSSQSSSTSIVMTDEGPQIVMQTQVVDDQKSEIGEHLGSLISGLTGSMSLPSSEEMDKAKEMIKKSAGAIEDGQARIDDMVLKSDSDLTAAEGQEHECKKMLSSMRDQLMSSVPALSEMAKQFIGGGL